MDKKELRKDYLDSMLTWFFLLAGDESTALERRIVELGEEDVFDDKELWNVAARRWRISQGD